MKHLYAAAKARPSEHASPKLNVWSRWALIGTLTAALLPVLPAAPALAADSSSGSSDKELERFEQVYQMIEKLHVSAPSNKSLVEAAIKGMVDSLNDPYTKYMNEKEWKQFLDSMSNNYVGIGVRVAQDEKGTYIVEVFSGSPAEKAGLKEGDYIVGVNDDSAAGKTTDELVKQIMGPEDTDVTINYSRGNETGKVTMKRKPIQLPVVTSNRFGGVGYIRVASFSDTADEKLAEILDSWKTQGLQSLVLDLRGNPGGLLETAQHIAEQFVKQGVLIHTSDRDKQDKPVLIENGKTVNVPVYVLVDQNSASASEVLTGALQDYEVAKVIGTKTYGKGSVQSLYEIDGGMLKVTVEEYFTPSGRPVNHVGITPDFEVDGGMNQLITALRKAGVQEFKLEKDRSEYRLNGFRIEDYLPMIQEDGKTFVHVRALASLIGADVAWKGDAGILSIVSADGRKVDFPLDAPEIRAESGLTLIDVAAFANAFPELEWSVSDKKMELSTKKRG